MNTKASRKLEGQKTLLGRTMHSIVYSEKRDEFTVPQPFAQALLTFRGGANGEESPIRVIQGPKTQLAYPSSVYVDLKNASGAVVTPDAKTFAAAAAGANWSKSFYQILTNQNGKDAWPITGATYIIMYKSADKPEASSTALKFFEWAYQNGDKSAEELEFVPLPASVKDLVRKQWASQMKDAAGKPIAFK